MNSQSQIPIHQQCKEHLAIKEKMENLEKMEEETKRKLDSMDSRLQKVIYVLVFISAELGIGIVI